jgi:hypothetical protein
LRYSLLREGSQWQRKKQLKARQKSAYNYGVVFLDHIDPAIPVESRKPIAINMTIDEGLKLHLALLQARSELNRLDRRSPASRGRGVRLSLFPDQKRLMVERGEVRDKSAPR